MLNLNVKSLKFIFLSSFLGLFLLSHNVSYAQPANVCQVTNPAPGAVVLPWLAARPAGSCGTPRQHLGVDIMLDTCTLVVNQQGCNIIMNGSSPIWGSNGSGYGYYMRYSCNNDVEVRFTHIHGYDATSQRVINGYSGAAVASAPHIHYEVYVQDGSGNRHGMRAMDPECVWGDSDASTCCQGVSGPCLLGNGPADLCNPTVRQQLTQNHSARATGGACNSPPDGYTSMAPQPGVPPFQVPPGQHIPPDVPPCDGTMPPPPPGPPGPTNVVITQEGSPVNTPPVIVYPGATVTFPPDPAGTEPNGTPGGAPDLTPSTPGGGAESGCAVDTWVSMVNQAVLEARRESIVNQRLIAKADSVLTYACFDQYVIDTGNIAGPIFSETSFWQNRNVDIVGQNVQVTVFLGSSSLDGALANTVNLAAASYLTSNFNHGLLGETAPVTAPSTGGSNCDVMNNVWQAAKCHNFETPFYQFVDIISSDPRQFPASMVCGNVSSGGSSITTTPPVTSTGAGSAGGA